MPAIPDDMQKPTISIIIPVGNKSVYLGEVLEGISDQTVEPNEVIVVDDRVTDSSLAPIWRTDLPVRIVSTTEERYGVSSARNIGADTATGDILVFIDSDVIMPENALEQIVVDLKHSDGVIGIQARQCGFYNFASIYKNQWMRYTYLRQKSPVSLFYTSLAGIKRDAFIKSGGFNEEYQSPSIEDTVYGNKLATMGFRIHIDKRIEYIHKKHYGIVDVMKTDYRRSRDLTIYFVGSFKNAKRPGTSVPVQSFMALPASLAGLSSILFSVFYGSITYLLTGLGLLIITSIVSLDFTLHIRKEEGLKKAILSSIFIIADMLSSSLGVVGGIIMGITRCYLHRNRRFR
ncbi:MAG: hypothetical protein DRH49_02200 [Candidatus Coatesbacteria bacterium]|nr:MAG: hypothetical protein DRH49_02200 [Candidatus Coatesbacteria bacterium]